MTSNIEDNELREWHRQSFFQQIQNMITEFSTEPRLTGSRLINLPVHAYRAFYGVSGDILHELTKLLSERNMTELSVLHCLDPKCVWNISTI